MRLIDADTMFDDCIFSHEWFELELKRFIGDVPTVDAEPVKHGHWISTGFMEVKCSICGAIQHELEDTNYCPNCGAKMAGVRRDDEQPK